MRRDHDVLRRALAHLEARCGCHGTVGCAPGRRVAAPECEAAVEYARRALMPQLVDLVRTAVREPEAGTCTKLVRRSGHFEACGGETIGEREETRWCADHVAEPEVA